MYDQSLVLDLIRRAAAALRDECIRKTAQISAVMVYGESVALGEPPLVTDFTLRNVDLTPLARAYHYRPISLTDLFDVFDLAAQHRNGHKSVGREVHKRVAQLVDPLQLSAPPGTPWMAELVQLMCIASWSYGTFRVRYGEARLITDQGKLAVASRYLESPTRGYLRLHRPLGMSLEQILRFPVGRKAKAETRISGLYRFLVRALPEHQPFIHVVCSAASNGTPEMRNALAEAFDVVRENRHPQRRGSKLAGALRRIESMIGQPWNRKVYLDILATNFTVEEAKDILGTSPRHGSLLTVKRFEMLRISALEMEAHRIAAEPLPTPRPRRQNSNVQEAKEAPAPNLATLMSMIR